MSYCFWTYNDLGNIDNNPEDIDELVEKSLNVNYQVRNSTKLHDQYINNSPQFGMAGFGKSGNYWGNHTHNFCVLRSQNVEDLLAQTGTWDREKVVYLACQIKLVKQREIKPDDWITNCNITDLKTTYEVWGSSKNKRFNSIQIAHNEEEWFKYCKEGIPACASVNFDTKNDLKFGKVYNFVSRFYSGSLIAIPTKVAIPDISDLSQMKYSYNGNYNEFMRYLIINYRFQFGASWSLDNNTHGLVWKTNEDFLRNDFWTDDNYPGWDSKEITIYCNTAINADYDECLLGLSYVASKDNKGRVSNEFIHFIKDYSFSGYSIRLLKY